MIPENKDLVPSTSKLSTSPVSPEVLLVEAQRVLQVVVSTHEDSFTPTSSMVEVCGFSTERIRAAANTVASVLFNRLEVTSPLSGHNSLVKKVKISPYNLEVGVRFGRLVLPSETTIPAEVLTLDVARYDHSLIRSAFPLSEPSEYTRGMIGYMDFRQHPYLVGRLQPYNKLADFQDFRLMVRGMRWIFANMLAWEEPGLIYPEALANVGLPSPAQS